MKRSVFIILILLLIVCPGVVHAIDSPHNGEDCSSCHNLHAAPGVGLTAEAQNYNLCLNCHNIGDKPAVEMASSDQAVPGTSGVHHRWDVEMCDAVPRDCGPNSTYGLRPPAVDPNNPTALEIQNIALNKRLASFGNIITCSVCHDQHNQARGVWDATSSAFFDSGRADSGTTASLVDADAGWTPGGLSGKAVILTFADLTEHQATISAGNTADAITFAPAAAQSVVSGTQYNIIDTGSDRRHFMRVGNDLNQLCEDCHYYRTTASETDTRTYTGQRKSHPIVSNLTTDVTDDTQFVGAAPLENNGNAQSGVPRYAGNGTGDAIVTNNIVLDGSATPGKIRCLSCHGLHYSDSDPATEETSADAGAGDGNLLKRDQEDMCHGCHKTERNTPGADPDKILMHNSDNLTNAGWVGGWGTAAGQYGEFGCTTCHTPHGTDNIYLIRETITTPDGSDWGDAGAQASPDVSVDFRYETGTAGGTTGAYSYGDDTACVEPSLSTEGACTGGGGTWDASVSRCTFPAFTDSGACTGAGHTWTPRTTSSRVCEVCHSKNTYHNYDSTDADQTGYGHNNGAACTGCHDHKNAFVGSGDCNTCHAYDTTGGFWQIGDGYACQDAPTCEGKGAHAKHINHIKALKSQTLDPANDSFGAGAPGIVCGTCHTNNSGNHISGGRVIDFAGSTVYQFGPSTPAYNGVSGTSSTVNLKSCSSVSCHFKGTPGWHDPATPGP